MSNLAIQKIEKHDSINEVATEADLIAGSALVVSRLLARASWRLRWITPSLVFYITFKNDIRTIIRMLRAYYDGRYRDLSRGTLLKLLTAIIYFLSPVHLITDVIPVIGWLDDALVSAWVIRSVRKDLDAFKEWETNSPAVVYA